MPGLGIGVASRRVGVDMNVFDSTLATSRGSVCASQLFNSKQGTHVFFATTLELIIIPVFIFRQRLDDTIGRQHVQQKLVFLFGSIANVNIRRLTQIDILFEKTQHLECNNEIQTTLVKYTEKKTIMRYDTL